MANFSHLEHDEKCCQGDTQGRQRVQKLKDHPLNKTKKVLERKW